MVSLPLNPLVVRVGGWEGSSHIDYGLSTSKSSSREGGGLGGV